MRKISVLLLAFLMVGGFAFGLDFSIEGDATLTWGVDLDEANTGFQNATSAKATVTIVPTATASAAGDGWYGVIAVEADDIKVESGEFEGGGASVTTAEITDGTFYIGILRPSTEFDFVTGFRGDDADEPDYVSGRVFEDEKGFSIGMRGLDGVVSGFSVAVVSADPWGTADDVEEDTVIWVVVDENGFLVEITEEDAEDNDDAFQIVTGTETTDGAETVNSNDYGLGAKVSLNLVPGLFGLDVATRVAIVDEPVVGVGVKANIALPDVGTIGVGFDSLVTPDFQGEARVDVNITAIENLTLFTNWYIGDFAGETLVVDGKVGMSAAFAPISVGAEVVLWDLLAEGELDGELKAHVGFAENGLSTKAAIESPLSFDTLELTLTVGLASAFHGIENTTFTIEYVSNDVMDFENNAGLLTFATKISL